MTNFPIFERVQVKKYALYAGATEFEGLDHRFCPGVNVIVGINGLGKTTLLNILLRSLTGAMDVPGDDQLGDKRRRLVAADRFWFRRRVPDDAVDARVTVWFNLGRRKFEVTRSLANLDILELYVDEVPCPISKSSGLEEEYRNEVAHAANLSSFDDFVFILRYLVFYLEDRRSLMWDPAAQGDILAILFGDQKTERRQYVDLFNELLSKDSEYRNMAAVVNKYRKKAAKQENNIDASQFDKIVRTLEERRKILSEVTRDKKEAISERDSLRERIENRNWEIQELREKLALKLNDYYESFFPSISDAARYLLAFFEDEQGCLVCGNTDKKSVNWVNDKLSMNVCPVCHSSIEEEGHSGHDPYVNEKIEEERKKIANAESELQDMERAFKKIESRYSEVSAKMIAVTAEVVSLEKQIDELERIMPGSVEKRNEVRGQIETFQAALNQIEVERSGLAKEFSDLSQSINNDVRSMAKRIEEAFAKYIQGFLAERCEISYTSRQSRIGQRTTTENFSFPHFIPSLTSGVHRQAATVREAGQSVSESQKEFIDLAFRMALLELAATGSATMLVLETPEASLDSVFVPRAADMLRRFASSSGGSAETKLIATSNVNREQMIPALFGAYPDQRFYGQVVDEQSHEMPMMVPMKERANHVLDLLNIAVPTRALERFRLAYEEERDRAIYPENYDID